MRVSILWSIKSSVNKAISNDKSVDRYLRHARKRRAVFVKCHNMTSRLKIDLGVMPFHIQHLVLTACLCAHVIEVLDPVWKASVAASAR